MSTIHTPSGPAPDDELSAEDRAYLDRTFTYHPPTGGRPTATWRSGPRPASPPRRSC